MYYDQLTRAKHASRSAAEASRADCRYLEGTYVGVNLQSKNNNVNKSNLPSSEQSDLTDGTSSEQLLQFDLVHIRGPTIRYIVFGRPSVDITGVVKAGRDRERAAGDKYRRGVRKAPRR